MEKEKVLNTLRWIGIFPAVVIVWIVSFWLFKFIGDWSWNYVITDKIQEGDILDYVDRTIASGCSVFATHQFGEYMAPNHKEKVGIIICILFILLAVVSMTISILFFKSEYWISIVAQIVTIVVASLILIDNLKIRDKNNNLKSLNIKDIFVQ
jgi:hypothetical protein